eukprot:CAMPEP_0197420836 /NCGR_PEP_ID=MMETSP1170-20131217/6206_1 /TAXON_ID=54406 /ORGANISM="Sarcinochrysis sp, Strain CCMP770" /LENGTH=277 /DNA_ID=CAMNT_0042948025 /DNA_START=82 /DNA_END=915 /DNA_ORIENTATION=+
MSKKYAAILATLRSLNSRAEAEFRRGMAEVDGVDGCEGAVAQIAERLRGIVEMPARGYWPPLRVCPEARRLLAALGFAETPGGGFSYAGDKRPATLALLDLAARALEAFVPSPRRASDGLKAEPDVGSAGTTTVVAVRGRRVERRRFFSSDSLADVLTWLRAAFDVADLDLKDVQATDPRRPVFEAADARRSLQALGLWPGCELQVEDRRQSTAKPRQPDRAATKPKPSDVFKAIAGRFDAADDPSRGGRPALKSRDAAARRASRDAPRRPLVPAPA